MTKKTNNKYTKFIATAATATLVASAIVPVASAASTFSDVADTNSHAVAINSLVEQGIINGYQDGTFKPNNQLTRGHVVKMLGKWVAQQEGFEIPADWNSVQRFDDLKVDVKDEELVKYAALLKDYGVFNGSNGELNAGDHITRENMALTLDRAYNAVFGTSLVEVASKTTNVEVADLATAKAEAQEEIQALRNLGISNVEKFQPKETVTRAQFASFLNRTIEAQAPVVEFEVSSIKGLNAKQVEVKFTQHVEEDSVIANDGTLVDGVFKFTKTEGNEVTANDATAELSEDGKTLTITAKEGQIFEGRYDVKVVDVQDVTGQKVKEFKQIVEFAKDTVAPTVVETKQVNATTAKVVFSEPVQEIPEGNVIFVYADGTEVAVGAIEFVLDGEELTFTLGEDVAVDKKVVAKIQDVKDKVGNLLSPNPVKVEFTKGNKDGVAPTVSSINQTGAKTFEIKFSEEIQGLKAENLSMKSGNELIAITDVKKSTNDATVYTVTAANALDGVVTISGKNITDFSGEVGTFSKVVTFVKDAKAPTVTSTEVVTDAKDGKEYLEISFDKDVVVADGAKLLNVNGTYTLDHVVYDLNTVESIDVDSKKDTKNVVRVSLDALLDGQDKTDAAYSLDFTLTGIKSVSDVAVAADTKTKVKFTRGESQTVITDTKAELDSVVQSKEDNNKVIVTFSTQLDGASADDVNNYKIDGVVVEDAIVAPFKDGKQVVTLTVEENSITDSVERNIEISGVKAKNGIAMDTYKSTIKLVENVSPEVSASLTADNEVTLTFNEDVTVSENAFELFVADSTTALEGSTVEAVSKANNKAVITLNTAFKAEDLAKGINVKLADKAVVEDVNGNKLRLDSLKIEEK